MLMVMLLWIVSESGNTTSSSSSSKRPRLDQLPAANLDADDPLDDDVSEDTSFASWNIVRTLNCKICCSTGWSSQTLSAGALSR